MAATLVEEIEQRLRKSYEGLKSEFGRLQSRRRDLRKWRLHFLAADQQPRHTRVMAYDQGNNDRKLTIYMAEQNSYSSEIDWEEELKG